jgi:hypothetical protein
LLQTAQMVKVWRPPRGFCGALGLGKCRGAPRVAGYVMLRALLGVATRIEPLLIGGRYRLGVTNLLVMAR